MASLKDELTKVQKLAQPRQHGNSSDSLFLSSKPGDTCAALSIYDGASIREDNQIGSFSCRTGSPGRPEYVTATGNQVCVCVWVCI